MCGPTLNRRLKRFEGSVKHAGLMWCVPRQLCCIRVLEGGIRQDAWDCVCASVAVTLTEDGLFLVSVDMSCRLSAVPALDVRIPASFDCFSAWFKRACIDLRIVRMLFETPVRGLILGEWLRHRNPPGGNIVDCACNVTCGASVEESEQWFQELSGAG